ncbi:hypothetical protein V8G54_012830 [Vigna mungo]|uniref:Uncharacterized protein n=1 Tax=Vigna mungo TaxID=3915 RepID=A0AAQ3S0Z3_VIGMU
MTGSLPDFSMFSNIFQYFSEDLSVNRLSGRIPDSSKFPPQLESLSLKSNTLEGGVPKSLGSTCTLRSLHLSNNSFNEELPLIMQNLSGCARSSLQELELRMNQIKGTLPDFSVFSSLKILSLDVKRLNGKIPKDIRFPTQLETLKMNLNSLGGGVPKSLGSTCTLRSLHLSNNSFNEELPLIMQNLSGCARSSLQELELRMNQIKGTLPDFSVFSSLKILSLDVKRLNGKIPKDIRFPTQLETLKMNLNSLGGVIIGLGKNN